MAYSFPTLSGFKNSRQVGKGNISFWCCDWSGEILQPSFDRDLTVKHGLQNLHEISHLLMYDQLDRIWNIVLDLNEDDKLVFSLTSSGNFSTSKYIGENRPSAPEVA